VGKGDTITLHTLLRSITVTLRVTEIVDGQVKPSDGAQEISVRLVMPKPKS
jgi:hypothetical protein